MNIVGSNLTDFGKPIPVLMMVKELGWGGGIERDVSKFARHLPKYGFAPHVACFRAGGVRWSEIQEAGIPIITVPVTSFKSRSTISGARQIGRYLKANNIQILHAFDSTTDLFGVPVGRLFRVPVVVASHLWCRSILSPHMRRLLAATDRLATGLFVNCNAVARELAADWNVNPRDLHVCHNGFEPSEFNLKHRRRPPELEDSSVIFGSVAVLRQEKNLDLLIQAFADVAHIDLGAKLIIVGEGPMKTALLQKAKELRIADRCLFKGATTTPAEFMKAIDVFVLPSASEAFSNAMLEAMACGCCPVASDVGGSSELVKHSERGMLFPKGDVRRLSELLVVLARDRAARERMASAAAQFVHEFLNIEVATLRLSTIYRELLTKRGISPRPDAVSVVSYSGALARTDPELSIRRGKTC